MAVGAVGGAGEELEGLPGDLVWLPMFVDPGKRQEELSTAPTPSPPHEPTSMISAVRGQ